MKIEKKGPMVYAKIFAEGEPEVWRFSRGFDENEQQGATLEILDLKVTLESEDIIKLLNIFPLSFYQDYIFGRHKDEAFGLSEATREAIIEAATEQMDSKQMNTK